MSGAVNKLEVVTNEKPPFWDVSAGAFSPGVYPEMGDLPAGVYHVDSNPRRGIFLAPHKMVVDDAIVFPDGATDELLKELNRFWTLRPHFVKRGWVHQRGFLLYGPPGTGKTVSVNLLAKLSAEKYNAIVIIDNNGPAYLVAGIRMVRQIEPNRPIIVIMEDLDDKLGSREADYLNLLDGSDKFNNVAYVATTNYIKRLSKRIANRPSRFDCLVKIGYPRPEDRRVYLKHKEPDLSDEQIEEWVAASNGFSVAHLKELSILVNGYQYSVAEAAERLNKMRKGEHIDERPHSSTG